MDVTDASFEHDVIDASATCPIVVDFWAEWCGPCRSLGPVLASAIEARGEQVRLVKVDVEASPSLAARFGVSGIPAVKAFRDGRVVDEFVGARSPASVAAFLDRLLEPPVENAIVETLRSSGEHPDVVAALDAGDSEAALALLVAAVSTTPVDARARLLEVAVAVFDLLGQDDPIVAAHRRRFAAALY